MASKCGAKTRAGGRCQQAGMPKNGRCRFHGGLSTGPKDSTNSSKNAISHGIYSRHMTDAERVDYAAVQLGTVDDELRMVRVQLARALAAQMAANGEAELDEVVDHDLIGQEGSQRDEKRKVRDYGAIVDRLTGRIESLEKTRLTLRAENPPDPESMDPGKLTAGTPDEPAPENPVR